MSKTIKLRRGLDIKLIGEADKVKNNAATSESYAIQPPDFHGLVPKMTVKVGDKVKAGTTIFYSKYNDAIKFASPVSGEILEIVRGEKRRILSVVIKADGENTSEERGSKDASTMSSDDVKAFMCEGGVWPLVKMRPIDVIANPSDQPKAIFVSAFDSAPLAPDYDFIMHGENEAFQAGINALTKLTSGKVHLTVKGNGAPDATFKNAKGVQLNTIDGKHPAGNVGTQIHHIDPINKGEIVWTVNPQDVLIIGRLFLTGKYDASKVIALTGSRVKSPKYLKTKIGATIQSLVEGQISDENSRIISGNVLSGDKTSIDKHLGYYHSQVSVIPEGNEPKFMITKGWMGPGIGKFSINRSYFSWLTPNKKFDLDTNLNGEHRAFVVTGELEKVFPWDVLPMQLIKSCMYKDIDLMEKLGIYEVAPEDFALCEFVCTSKIDIQEVIREGLDLIHKECM